MMSETSGLDRLDFMLVFKAVLEYRGSVALATDERDFGRDECHFLKQTGRICPANV